MLFGSRFRYSLFMGIILIFLSSCEKEKPSVETGSVSEINTTSAIVSGSIISMGDGVDAYGHCWSLTELPTPDNDFTDLGKPEKAGSFITSISGLTPGETYFVRAWVEFDGEIIFGEQISFITLDGSVSLNTVDFSDRMPTTFIISGNIVQSGGSEVVLRGFCWNMEGSPDLSNCLGYNEEGSGIGPFTSTISSLEPNTEYKIRVYATNNMGTTYYGNELSVATIDASIEIYTENLRETTYTTAVLGGSISEDWDIEIIAKGICWGDMENPSIDNSLGYTVEGTGNSSFQSTLNDLEHNTGYYARAYASNAYGTSYGAQVYFRTSSFEDYDGNLYREVHIGNQIWMDENLRTTHYSDGRPVEFIVAASEYLAANTEYINVYGGYYTWNAAMDNASHSDLNPSGIQGVCPTGWHLPSDSEWKELEVFLGMTQAEANSEGWRGTDISDKMIKTGLWLQNSTASNSSGFSALPGGLQAGSFYSGDELIGGDIYNVGYLANFWTSTLRDYASVWVRRLDGLNLSGQILRYTRGTGDGYSVRCVKD